MVLFCKKFCLADNFYLSGLTYLLTYCSGGSYLMEGHPGWGGGGCSEIAQQQNVGKFEILYKNKILCQL